MTTGRPCKKNVLASVRVAKRHGDRSLGPLAKASKTRMSSPRGRVGRTDTVTQTRFTTRADPRWSAPITTAADAALSRIFSRQVFRELSTNAQSPLLSRLIPQSDVLRSSADAVTLADFFDQAYQRLLRPNRRSAYAYKNLLFKKRLRRSFYSSMAIMDEFRIGAAVADIVTVDTRIRVFEIKSDRDSFARIQKQIPEYQKFGAEVFVVLPATQESLAHSALPPECGIITLSDRNTFRNVRQPSQYIDSINIETICSSLRIDELLSVARQHNVDNIPDSNMHIRSYITDSLSPISTIDVRHTAISALRKRRFSTEETYSWAQALPESLQYLGVSVKLDGVARDTFSTALARLVLPNGEVL